MFLKDKRPPMIWIMYGTDISLDPFRKGSNRPIVGYCSVGAIGVSVELSTQNLWRFIEQP